MIITSSNIWFLLPTIIFMLLTAYHAVIGGRIRSHLRTMVLNGQQEDDLFAIRISLARKHFYRLLIYVGLTILTTFLLTLSAHLGFIPGAS